MLRFTGVQAPQRSTALVQVAETDAFMKPYQAAAALGAPFVGRDRELAELVGLLSEAAEGRGGLVLIGGEPGIGKSRLAEQLGTHAREAGMRVLVGRCWDGAGAPAYWPWVQAIRALLRTTDEATLRRQLGGGALDIGQMVPEVQALIANLPKAPEAESESARFQLFDSATRFLQRASENAPLLILIDDLHAADTPSVLFLQFLASQLGEARTLVVATYRDVELTADAPLTHAINEIARQPSTRVLALSGLGEDQIGSFIEVTAGIAPPAKLTAAIARETRGNPLFLGEAVRLLAAEGRLGDVATGQALHLPIPPGIRDVITRRVRHLGDEVVTTLVHAAALGPEFSVEVLRRVLDREPEELLDGLGAAARAGLVAPVPSALGRFRFAHDLIRETLYDEVGPGQRVRLHRKIADTLEALYGAAPQGYLAELAHHYFEASRGGEPGDGEGKRSAAQLTVGYAREAGDQALRSLAYEEAARLYRMALAALDLNPAGAEAERLDLLLRLGEAEARAGDLPGSRQTYLEAAGLARRAGAAAPLARAVLGYGGRLYWARVGHDPHLIPLLQDALVLLGGSDDRLKVRLLTRLACAWRSDPDRAEQRRALTGQAVQMARSLADAPTLGYALVGQFWAAWFPDNAEDRLAIANEMLAVAEAAGDAERTIDAHLMLFLVFMDLGRMADARARMDTIFQLGRELRQPAQLWLTWASRVVLALLEGDYATAEETMARETEPGHPTTPINDDVSAARMHRFLLRREQGRGAEEEPSVRASVEEFPWYPLHRSALACLLADDGRVGEARGVLRELATDGFSALYRDCEWLLGIALAAEACSLLGDQVAAATLYEQLLPFAGGHAIGHTEGSVGAVDRYLGLLAASRGRLDDAVRHLEDGITGNERLGAPPWIAHTQHDLAGVLRRRGHPGDLERAEELDAAAAVTAHRLGMSALAAAIGTSAAAIGQQLRAGAAAEATFRREGEYWTVAYDGSAFRIRDARGMRHLARLLAEPGRELHALDLASGANDRAATRTEAVVAADPFGGLGPALDREARTAYAGRVDELRGEIAEAEAWNDSERAARARDELEVLARELAGAVGLGGRDRPTGSPAERARLSVSRAIRASLARIAEQSPALGRHFEATVRTGVFCSYRPDPRVPITWRL